MQAWGLVLVVLCAVLGGVLFCCDAASADTIYFDSESGWQAAASGYDVEAFDFTPANMVLSNEVGPSEPSAGDILSGVQALTFSRGSTGLGANFVFVSPYYDFHYTDLPSEFNVTPHLTFGGSEGSPNDDWEVTFGDGVYAFGFYLLANDEAPGESWQIRGTDDSLLLTVSTIPTGRNTAGLFMGVVSDVAIGRVVFDEDPGGDDIGIAAFRLGTQAIPEPGSVLLVALGAAGLGFARRRKAKATS